MSASHPQAGQLPRGGSLLSNRLKEAGRALLAPLVRLAQRLGITPNRVTVIGFAVVVVAAGLVAFGQLLAGRPSSSPDPSSTRSTGRWRGPPAAAPRSAASSTRPSTARPRRSCTPALVVYFLRSDGRPDRAGRPGARRPVRLVHGQLHAEPRPRRSASRPRLGSLHAPSGSCWSWPASRSPGSASASGSSAPSASSPPCRRQPPSSASGTFNAR